MWLKWAKFGCLYLVICLLCIVAKYSGRSLCILCFICGQRRTGTVFMSCQVAFSALSFLTTGAFQKESWASIRHICLTACLLDMMLSNMLCLVHPYLFNTTPRMRKVIAMFSTSLILTVCYLKIYGDAIPTRREDICSNVFLSVLEVYLKKCGLVFNSHTWGWSFQ